MLITATTATPLAPLTGLVFKNGVSASLYFSGMALNTSTTFGIPFSLRFFATEFLREVKFNVEPSS